MAPSDDRGQMTEDRLKFAYLSSVLCRPSSGFLVVLATLADDVGDVVLLFLLRHDEGAVVHRLFFDLDVLVAFASGGLATLALLVRLFERDELGLGHLGRRNLFLGDRRAGGVGPRAGA